MTNETKPAEKFEPARTWYERTTRKSRKLIAAASVIGLLSALVFFFVVPHEYTLRLQVFNGAWVIPVFGAIWIWAFVWIFLIPSREVGFRSQESIERMENSITPVLEIWKKLGDRIESELNSGLISEFKEGVKTLREAAAKIQTITESSSGDLKSTAKEIREFKAEVKPTLEALQRIQGNLQKEIDSGFFDNIRTAMDSVRQLGGMPAGKPHAPPAVADLDKTLKMIAKSPRKHPLSSASAPAQVPQVNSSYPVDVPAPELLPAGPLPAGPVPVGQAPIKIEKMQS